MHYDEVAAVIERFRRGGLVVVADDADRENEGDVILAAEFATPEALAFMITQGRGLVCLALEQARADELGLDLMSRVNSDPLGTAFTTSIDALPQYGVTTGISATDRAITARLAVDGVDTDFSRPGHLFPLIARAGGVRERRGHTEAAVDLARLAGLAPLALIVEVIGDDGEMRRGSDLVAFARTHDLPITNIAALHDYVTAAHSAPTSKAWG